MPHPLDDCRLKLARAKQHIQEFNDDIIVRRNLKIPADSVRAHIQFEGKQLDDGSAMTFNRRVTFFLKGTPPPIDPQFSIWQGKPSTRSGLCSIISFISL